MIDAHNHLHDPRFHGQQADLIKIMQDQGISACVVNGTSETDWPAVASLAESFPHFVIPSFGLHPWKINARSDTWDQTLASYLEKFPLSAIGECGLDYWMRNPDLPGQLDVFRRHLTLAHDLKRPLTIHCLKAWGPLLTELRASPTTLSPFLLHSFSGSLETARQCLSLPVFFSFSGYFLHPRKAKIREIFQQLPPGRILIETDAPDMVPPNPRFSFESQNHPANLLQISEEIRSFTSASLLQIEENTRHFLSLPSDFGQLNP